MHIMSILCSSADAISSGSCPILFKVLTLNVAICSVCLHFSSFDCLSSVADFSNTEARAPTSAGRAPFFTRAKSNAVCVCSLCMQFVYAVCVCSLCMQFVYAVCVCSLCMQFVYAVCVCSLCMQFE